MLNQGTRTTSFDDGWKFKLVSLTLKDPPVDDGTYGNSTIPRAAAVDFPDGDWQNVTLPHDWSSLQDPSPANGNATGYFPGGLGWYRKTFTLPAADATVIALHADNTTETLPVTWQPLPAAAATHTGRYTVTGTVQGTQAPATATVTVYRHASIQSWSTAVAVGDAPMLPAKVRLIDNDGVSRLVPVTWNAVDPSSYAAPGHFSVLGSVAGTALKALATVRVTDQFAGRIRSTPAR